MEQRVDQLINDFPEYLKAFEDAELFTGPSLYFHVKTINLRQSHSSAVETLDDHDFFDALYATLASWGMHRMGRVKTKLIGLPEITKSFRSQKGRIRSLESLSLSQLSPPKIQDVTRQVWEVLSRLKVGISKTKIVANSKALHHLLPSMVPPIDRSYTLRFFFNNKMLNQGDKAAFAEVFPRFAAVARSRKEIIQRRLGNGMNTSESKVIDNAIVGFVHRHLTV